MSGVQHHAGQVRRHKGGEKRGGGGGERGGEGREGRGGGGGEAQGFKCQACNIMLRHIMTATAGCPVECVARV